MSHRRMRHLKQREVQGCDVAYDFSNPLSLYDATSGGSLVVADGTIARAEDLSGNGLHATQGTSGRRPVRKLGYAGGNDAALYSGGQTLNAGNVAPMLDKPANVVGVIRRNSGNDGGMMSKTNYISTQGRYGVFWLIDGKALALSHAPGTSAASWTTKESSSAPSSMTIYALQANRTAGTNAATTSLRKNGAIVATGETYTDSGASVNPPLNLYVGSAGDNTEAAFLNGHIGQVAKYSAVLSDALYRRIELAIARKWRIAT